jgi:DNA polymerase V
MQIHRLAAAPPSRRTPLVLERVHAGWPSVAQDYFDGTLDLNEHLIADPVSTFIVRVTGDSMIGAGIADGDELIVDRALRPRDGAVVIAVLNNELTVKRLRLGPPIRLCAENPDYPDLRLSDGDQLDVWGVVTRCLHHV